MKKNILFWFFCLSVLLPGTASCREPEEPSQYGLFVSVIQDPPVLSSREAITKLIRFAKQAHIQILFVQIYYANKTWFSSTVGDPGPYKTCVQKIGEDPFALLIREAHAAGVQVHAWLNMLSLNSNKNAPLLKKYGTSILTQDRRKKLALEDYKIDKQFFLEPGDLRVRKELLTMVGEMLHAYPELDGVQFDYIRYPDMHPVYGYSEMNIKRFKKTTGLSVINDNDPAWQDWKRRQVTELLDELVQRSRAIRPHIQVSATGCMPWARAYYEAFQDWSSWTDRGIVDFVTLMNYSPDPPQYEQWNLQAKTKTQDFTKTNIGVGAYKSATTPEIFSEELQFCEKTNAKACVVFHYGSLLENPALERPLTGSGKTG